MVLYFILRALLDSPTLTALTVPIIKHQFDSLFNLIFTTYIKTYNIIRQCIVPIEFIVTDLRICSKQMEF